MEMALRRRGTDVGLLHIVPPTTGHLHAWTSGVIDLFFFGSFILLFPLYEHR
jgi:hypothetical protein